MYEKTWRKVKQLDQDRDKQKTLPLPLASTEAKFDDDE